MGSGVVVGSGVLELEVGSGVVGSGVVLLVAAHP